MNYTILATIFNELKSVTPKLKKYLKRGQGENNFRIHPDHIDINKIIVDEAQFDIFNELSTLLELIYKDKRLSFLISDIALFLAMIDMRMFLYYEVSDEEKSNITSRTLKHIDISLDHFVSFYKITYWNKKDLSNKNNEEYTILYTSNKLEIDKITELWIDGRSYFEYDGPFRIYGSFASTIIFSKLTWELDKLKVLKKNLSKYSDWTIVFNSSQINKILSVYDSLGNETSTSINSTESNSLINTSKQISSWVQFLYIFWIVGFWVYWINWSDIWLAISGVLIIWLIMYTKYRK